MIINRTIRLSLSETDKSKMLLVRYCNSMMQLAVKQDNLIAYQFYMEMAKLITDDCSGNIMAHILLHAKDITEVYEDPIDQQTTSKVPVVD